MSGCNVLGCVSITEPRSGSPDVTYTPHRGAESTHDGHGVSRHSFPKLLAWVKENTLEFWIGLTATNSRRPACLGSGVAASRELASVSRQRVRSQGPWASTPFGTVTSGAEGRAVGSEAQGFPTRRVLQGRHRMGAPTG